MALLKHLAAALAIGHMTFSQTVVCLISARHMLEVLPIIVHPLIIRVIGYLLGAFESIEQS